MVSCPRLIASGVVQRPLAVGLLAALLLAGPTSAQLTADFTASPTAGVVPLNVVFTDTSSGGVAAAWNWSFGDGTFGTAQHPSHLYTTPGVYTVSLTVFGTGGEFDAEIKTGYVTVNNAAVVPDFVATPTQGFLAADVTFTNTTMGGPVTAWLWDFGDGATSTQQHPQHTFTGYGTYDVSLTAFVFGQQESVTKSGFITIDAAFSPRQHVAMDIVDPVVAAAGDLDADGDVDVAVAYKVSNGLRWYEHLDGQGGFEVLPHEVAAGLPVAHALLVLDPDEDGAGDIIYGGNLVGIEVSRFANDGHGMFGAKQVLGGGNGPLSRLEAGDVDGDQDIDLAYSSGGPNGQVLWLGNEGGLFDDATQRTVDSNCPEGRGLGMGDLDGDGDVDILAIASGDDEALWYEQVSTPVNSWPETVLDSFPFQNTYDAVAGDIDGDGDVDAVVVHGGISWYSNLDGQGSFSDLKSIAIGSHTFVRLGDMDCDGDLDMMALEAGEIRWYENVDGLGSFAPGLQPTLTPAGQTDDDFSLVDFDLDGDLDVLATSSSGAHDWLGFYRNLLPPCPWTHLDGGSQGVAGVPHLRAKGTLEAGGPVTLTLQHAPSSTLTLAWLSFTSVPVSVLGGTLYAQPHQAQLLLATDVDGTWSQSIPWPSGIAPGIDFWLQVIVQDGSVPAGLTLSNAVGATTP